jgi:carboxymethylenebutenolidase
MNNPLLVLVSVIFAALTLVPVAQGQNVKDLVKRQLDQAIETRDDQARQADPTNTTPTVARPTDPNAPKPMTLALAAAFASDSSRTSGWVLAAAADGTPVRLYYAHPRLPADAKNLAAPLPALIVVQEWWGLTDDIQARSNDLAAKGYFAVAVDLYDGQATKDPKKAAELKAKMTDAGALVRLKTGLDVLAELSKKGFVNADHTGVIGWCMGGEQALKVAIADPRVKATAIFYGPLVTDAATLKSLKGPVLGMFGNLDQTPSPASVDAFEAALKADGIPVEIHRYDGVGHAFASKAAIPMGMYHAKEAADAWAKTYVWLDKTLKAAPATLPAATSQP